ncbi:MAG: type II toxin-antitoxin system VapC family toxin [Nitrososphaerales archaeon]
MISQEEAINKAEHLAKILEIIEVTKIESNQDFRKVMELATELKLTFYDASYLHAAKNRKFTLVTEDMELKEKAEQASIEAITVSEFLGSYSH